MLAPHGASSSPVPPGVAPGSVEKQEGVRATSEEGRLEVRLLARGGQSHDHHGISKKVKGYLMGLEGRGQIMMPL